MACQGCTNGADPTAATFDRVFDRFWPATLPFPPAAPYLAAAVGRAEARQWATDLGADRDPGVLSGDPIAMLDMAGAIMAAIAGGSGSAPATDAATRRRPAADVLDYLFGRGLHSAFDRCTNCGVCADSSDELQAIADAFCNSHCASRSDGEMGGVADMIDCSRCRVSCFCSSGISVIA